MSLSPHIITSHPAFFTMNIQFGHFAESLHKRDGGPFQRILFSTLPSGHLCLNSSVSLSVYKLMTLTQTPAPHVGQRSIFLVTSPSNMT